jgi:DNA-binding NarL/FixJ family response regulator
MSACRLLESGVRLFDQDQQPGSFLIETGGCAHAALKSTGGEEGVQLHTCRARIEKPELLIVDSKRLRQAAIMRLLEAWADAMGLTVKAVIPDALLATSYTSENCEMIIFSLGGASIQDASQVAFLAGVRRLIPQVPLVIISDRDEPQEVYAAFQQEAIGFMPTSMEPTLAFQALSFMKSGGSFFPPSVLSTRLGEVTIYKPPSDSDLTIKQEDVFDLLRQGFPNKVIAHRLGMSEATVKVHARRIMHKFGVSNRTQLAVAAMNHGSSLNDSSNAEPSAGDQVSEASPRSASSRARA